MKSVQNSEAYSSFWCWAPRETLWLLLDSGACALTSWNSACRCYSCCFHLNLLPTICYSLLIHVAKYQLLNFAGFFVSPFLVDLSGSNSFLGTHTTVLRIMPYLGTCGLVWMYIYIYSLKLTVSILKIGRLTTPKGKRSSSKNPFFRSGRVDLIPKVIDFHMASHWLEGRSYRKNRYPPLVVSTYLKKNWLVKLKKKRTYPSTWRIIPSS